MRLRREDHSRSLATQSWKTPAVLRWCVAVLVSGGLFLYLFAAQGVNPRELGPLLSGISVPAAVAFVLVSLVGVLLVALRYWILLERRAPFGSLILVTLVRNLFVHLLPVRAGAAASYLYLVTARLGLPAEAAVNSMVLSFILDTLALAPLLLLAAVVVGGALLPSAFLIGLSLAILGVSLLALFLLGPVLRLASRVAQRLPGRLARSASPLGNAAQEVRRLAIGRVLAPALALSILIRLAKYGAYYCLLCAILLSQGWTWASLNPFRVFLGVLGAELAASLPLPTVASLGPYEAAGTLGFVYWLGLSRELATLVATLFHGLSQALDDGLGAAAFLWIIATTAARHETKAMRSSGERPSHPMSLSPPTPGDPPSFQTAGVDGPRPALGSVASHHGRERR
jgi:Lysylphosphatidylglycerol synthase TM region